MFGCMYMCQDSFHALPLPMIVCMSDSLQMEPFVSPISPSQYTRKYLLTLHKPESYTSCKLGCELYLGPALTTRQTRHLPRAPKQEGPQDSANHNNFV